MAESSLRDAVTRIVASKLPVLLQDSAINISLATINISELLSPEDLGQVELYRNLLILEAYLRAEVPVSGELAKQVWEWVCKRVHPARILSSDGTITPEEKYWELIGNVAVILLKQLTDVYPNILDEVSVDAITTLIFWKACHVGDAELDYRSSIILLLSSIFHRNQAGHTSKQANALTRLLEQVVRPSFHHSRPKNITAAGRQAIDPQPQALTSTQDDKHLKAWRFGQRYAVDVLIWVLQQSESKALEANWHNITPPILTLIDDEDVSSKVRGCECLQILFDKVTSSLWARTGLGKVFQDALTPALSYLPPLTDQNDSEKLLAVAYATLLSLCILTGLAHSGENVRISALLLDQSVIILNQMGIQCVKHLKTFVPVLIGYLYDPFAFASPVLLLSTIKSLQTLILNAWPRMDQHHGEIVMGITVCWQRLAEEKSTDTLLTAKAELGKTLKILETALRDPSKAVEIENMMRHEETLAGLLSS